MERETINVDVLIIGGGTAGCFAALTLSKSNLDILIAEKANIKRSGCLAAGVNAINAYITKGKTPSFYVEYARKDADGIVREDLLLSMSERLNDVTCKMEELGLVILKDENGEYVTRGDRNIKINGENIKPILANAVNQCENVRVLNHINITDYIIKDHRVIGAYGFNVDEKKSYAIYAKQTLCATGGAAGLYKPNNPGFSRHKMWYPPFNTGAGYAMGILAGAEMTTFEMRFIALRCKDTIAPTGTIAQGVRAKQTNSKGEIYETKYGLTTSQRLYGTVMENRNGNGPCYLDTTHIDETLEEDLYKAYLNMAPSQTLKWLESGVGPKKYPVEVEGTEPYIVGGHTASGYWVDNGRRTTIEGLYAAGDVSGGCPQKYVTGALAEGEIAAQAILKDREKFENEEQDIEKNNELSHNRELNKELNDNDFKFNIEDVGLEKELEKAFEKKIEEYEKFLNNKAGLLTIDQIEETMQKVMDEYAGGISKGYQFNNEQLTMAADQIYRLSQMLGNLKAVDMDDLLKIYEIRERLVVCQVLIEHLRARKETRWHSFAENTDYPEKSDDWLKYVNSRLINGKIQVVIREMVTKDTDGKILELSDTGQEVYHEY